MKISLIVAASENNVIGKDKALLWHLSADLKRFKAMTMGNTIVMGRKTFQSIGKALPERRNIVISTDSTFKAPDCEVVTSMEQALQILNTEPEVFIIGGGSIYTLFWEKAERLYLTLVHTTIEGDTFIPPIDRRWVEVQREDFKADEKNEFDYSFIDYEKSR
ncbi:dihydrofolate reductase [Bacteroidia bacterium]|nr:dihydrofolate reductase [Bacteroidia bacterium]